MSRTRTNTLYKTGEEPLSTEARDKLSHAMGLTRLGGVDQLLERLNPHDAARQQHLAKTGQLREALLENYTDTPRRLSPGEQKSLTRAVPLDELEGLSKDMESDLYKSYSKDFFRKAWGIQEGNLAEWTPQRVRVTHRILRALIYAKGSYAHDDRLGEMSRYEIVKPTMRYDLDRIELEYGHKWIRHIDNVSFCRERSWFYQKQTLITDMAGLGFMPPPVPLDFIEIDPEDGYLIVSEEYDPAQDKLLTLWMDEIGLIIDHYRIGEGIPSDDQLGIQGLAGITDRNTIRFAWPSLESLCAWEDFMVGEIVKTLVSKGSMKTHQWLVYDQGYSQSEAKGYLKMAAQMARELTERDQDEQRGVMIMRLEEMMEMAHENLDMKALNNAHKQMAMILGLTRSEADDQMQDFMATVKRVSATAVETAVDAKLLDSAQEKGLDR